jgi:peptidyl-prolyl cis-trans isomerase B (cyclophilin B)
MLARTLLTAALLVGLAAGCQRASSSGETPAAPEAVTDDANETAIVTVKNFGEIRIRFFPEKAPNHVSNFKKLARNGFYDGVTFHRIIPGFMIQGGDPHTKDDDPRNDGTGGPGYTVKAEFNDVPHTRGIVSMARANHPDSAGSQFFIVVKDSNFLDRKYTVFGEVAAGMQVADEIVKQPRDKRDRPKQEIVIETIRIEKGPEAS